MYNDVHFPIHQSMHTIASKYFNGVYFVANSFVHYHKFGFIFCTNLHFIEIILQVVEPWRQLSDSCKNVGSPSSDCFEYIRQRVHGLHDVVNILFSSVFVVFVYNEMRSLNNLLNLLAIVLLESLARFSALIFVMVGSHPIFVDCFILSSCRQLQSFICLN